MSRISTVLFLVSAGAALWEHMNNRPKFDKPVVKYLISYAFISNACAALIKNNTTTYF